MAVWNIHFREAEMDVVIPYQKSYAIPTTCCVCGATNPVSKFQIKSKEVRQFATTASVTLTFMKCQTCVDEYEAIKKTQKPGMGIGFGIGLLLGVAIGVALFLASGDTGEAQGDLVNKIIGPVIAIGGIFGLIGLIIGKGVWSMKLDPKIRQRMRILESPVTIVAFGYETGFIGNVKNAILKLHFSNDAYSRSFMALNGYPVE
jgi:hypothetical protein